MIIFVLIIHDHIRLDYCFLWYTLPVSIAHSDLRVYLPQTYHRKVFVHQNKVRDESIRESRPLLSTIDLGKLRSNNLEATPFIDREEVNDDRKDFQIPTFRYVY